MRERKPSGLKRTYIIKGLLFLLPAILFYLFFAVIPFVDNFVLSFQNWGGFNARTFAGLTNYVTAFTDDPWFLYAIRNSAYIGAVSSFFSVIVGVLLAWLLLYTSRGVGGVYRTILFSPSMIPAVITALVFAFVYEPEMGILNSLLEFLHLEGLQRAWLTNRSTALNSITFVLLWKQIGLTMVLCFAGMQAIPPSLLESAYIEGANDFQIFRKIILPLTMTFIQLSAVFALMSGLKVYDTVLALTNGGPGNYSTVMTMWILEKTFYHNRYGYGAALSMIFVAVILVAFTIVKQVVRGKSYEL